VLLKLDSYCGEDNQDLKKKIKRCLRFFSPNSQEEDLDLKEEQILELVINLAQELDFQLDAHSLRQKCQISSLEKDKLFNRRLQKLNEISSEIRRFETLIKLNGNSVDNMIVPLLRAVSQTFNEHRLKYKELK